MTASHPNASSKNVNIHSSYGGHKRPRSPRQTRYGKALTGTGRDGEAVGEHSQSRTPLNTDHIVNKFGSNLRWRHG
jgi:hypothetical protein